MLGRLTERRGQPVVMAGNVSGEGLAAGDTVVLGLRDDALVSASLLIYLLPLGLMLLASLSAHLLLDAADGLVAVAGICGLLAGFGWVARRSGQPGWADRYRPVVLRRANGETSGLCEAERSGT